MVDVVEPSDDDLHGGGDRQQVRRSSFVVCMYYGSAAYEDFHGAIYCPLVRANHEQHPGKRDSDHEDPPFAEVVP